jgi:hypothetical protein
MSEADKKEAKERLARAGRQGKHAAKNVARAAVLGGELAAEEAKDVLVHAADMAEEVAEEIVDETKRVAPKVSTMDLVATATDLGVGFMALAVSLYSGNLAFHKFRNVLQGRRGMR